MISILMYGSNERKNRHEAVVEEFQALCKDVSRSASEIKTRLENGAGEAIKERVKHDSMAKTDKRRPH